MKYFFVLSILILGSLQGLAFWGNDSLFGSSNESVDFGVRSDAPSSSSTQFQSVDLDSEKVEPKAVVAAPSVEEKQEVAKKKLSRRERRAAKQAAKRETHVPKPAKSSQAQPVDEVELPSGTNYAICPLDLIRVEVFQEPDLLKEVRVAADGSVSLPLIGRVELKGRSLSDAIDEVRERYDRDFIVNPQVSMHVLEYAERKIQVLGEVNTPGFVEIPPEREMNITEAISGAGGLTRRARERGIEITRRMNSGAMETIQVNFREALKNPSKNIKLSGGDIVFVPESIF